MKSTKLTQRICLHGYPSMEVPALPSALPGWPEIEVVLCRPHEHYHGELRVDTKSWNVIHRQSGLKVNAGCVSPTRKQAVTDAVNGLNRIAEAKGRAAVLRFVELETARSPLVNV